LDYMLSDIFNIWTIFTLYIYIQLTMHTFYKYEGSVLCVRVT